MLKEPTGLLCYNQIMKWTKGRYTIEVFGQPQEVDGIVCGNWGIDKRANQFYILTHIPTGYMVDSSRTQKFLKEAAESEEFQSFAEDEGRAESVASLGKVLQSLRNKYGWK